MLHLRKFKIYQISEIQLCIVHRGNLRDDKFLL
jgi:hypothetical protein